MDNADLTPSMQELMAQMARMQAELNDLKQRANAVSQPDQPAKPAVSTTRRRALRKMAGGLLTGLGVAGVAAALPSSAEAKIIANPTGQNNRIGAIITAPGNTVTGSLYDDGSGFKLGLVVLSRSASPTLDISNFGNIIVQGDTAILARGEYNGLVGSGGIYGVFGSGNYGVYGSGANTGVFGYGGTYGVFGNGQNGTGVYGTSSGGHAVMADGNGTGLNGAALYAKNPPGIAAWADNNSGDATLGYCQLKFSEKTIRGMSLFKTIQARYSVGG